jgi:O-antigen/teichoic acid export membrane protein
VGTAGILSKNRGALKTRMTAITESRVLENKTAEAHKISGSKLLAGATSLSASQVVRGGFRTLFLLLAARQLGPEVFGLYVLLLTVTEILALVSGSGFGNYLTREVAKNPGSAYQLLFRIIQLRFAYLLVLAAIAIPGLSLLRYSSSIVVNASLLSLTLLPRAIAESSQGIMRAMHRFGAVFWIELLQGTVLLGTGAFFLLGGRGLRGVIWAELASVLLGATVALPIALRLSPKRTQEVSGWRELIRKTFAFNLFPLIGNTYDRVDVVLLSKLVGNTAVGIYSLPYRAFAALSIVPYGIMGTLFPSLARSAWGQDERERCGATMQLLYAAALFLILGTMLLADAAVRFALGPGYQGSVAVFKILAWATVPSFLNYALNIFLLARNRERVFLRTASVCTVVNIAANVLLIPRYSYIAAAGVTILTEAVLLGQNLALVRKTLGYLCLPKRALGNSLVFAATLIAAHESARFLPALGVAAGALAIFAVYLHAANRFQWSTAREETVCAV